MITILFNLWRFLEEIWSCVCKMLIYLLYVVFLSVTHLFLGVLFMSVRKMEHESDRGLGSGVQTAVANQRLSPEVEVLELTTLSPFWPSLMILSSGQWVADSSCWKPVWTKVGIRLYRVSRAGVGGFGVELQLNRTKTRPFRVVWKCDQDIFLNTSP